MTFESDKCFAITATAFAVCMAILLQMAFIESTQSAYALTRYINCVTKVANHNGTLTVDDVRRCYDKVFIGAHDADEFGHALK